jgi:PAS domain S-box-containing protein
MKDGAWQESLFETAAVGIAVVNPDRTIRAHNRRLAVLFGREDLVGAHVSELFHGGENDDVSAPYVAEMLAGRLERYSYERLFERNGSPFWMRVSIAPVPRSDLLSVFCEDIDASKRAEEAVREQGLLFERARRIGGIASWAWYPHEGRSEWSEETRELLGIDEEQVLRGDTSLFFELVHPDDREAIVERLRHAFETGKPTGGEYRIVRPSDGDVRWLREQAEVEVDANGKPHRMLGVVVDVTAQKRAELDLLQQTAVLARAQELAGLGGFRVDIGRRTISISDEVARLFRVGDKGFELPLEEYRQRFLHPDDYAHAVADADKAYSARGPLTVESRIIRGDGAVIWARARSSVEAGADGSLFAIGVIQDITEQKQAELALQRNASFLARAQEIAGFGTYRVDLTERTVHLSDELARMFGSGDVGFELPIEEFRVRFYHPDDRDRVIEGAEWGYAQHERAILEYRMIRPDGQVRWVRAYTDVGPSPTVLVGAMLDITEQRNQELALRERETELGEAQRFGRIGTWAWYPADERVSYSAEALAILGGSGNSEQRMLLSSVLHPDDVQAVLDGSRDAFEGGHRYEDEVRIIRNGEVRWLRIQGECDADSSGRPYRLVGAMMDVTESRREAEERRQLEDQLRQSQKLDAIGRLAGGVAHDFNNILTVINGHAMLGLADPSLAAEARFEGILEAGERAAVLVRKLLMFSRQQPVKSELVDLNTVVRDAEGFLRRLIETTIDITVTTCSEPLPVLVDRVQVDQVLLNLATNARDAMPDGGRLAIETAIAAGEDGESAVMIVTDTGVGIGDEIKEHIFEPFFTTKPAFSGTGLGLATVYGIVESANGAISVESQAGAGATFRVVLPLAEDARLDAPEEKIAAVTAVEPGIRVLLVDDDEHVRAVAQGMLERLGYDVVSAPTTDEAIDAAGRERFDLLVTDISMPGLAGTTLAAELRVSRPDLPVLFISGYSEEQLLEHAPPTGSAYLAKPFSMKALQLRLADLLTSQE